MYRPLHLWILTIGLCFAAVLTAGADDNLTGVCHCTFYATSTLKNFKGTVTTENVQGSVVPAGGDEIWSVMVDTAVSEMTTNNKKRDKHMRTMFEAAKFPNIRCKVSKARLSEVKPGRGQSSTVPLDLTICEITRRINGKVTNWREADGVIQFDCAFDVSLKSFKLKPHSLLGILRVGDRVHVLVHVKLKRHPKGTG